MNIKLQEIAITTKLPEIPRSMPVFKVKAPSFEKLQPAISQLQEVLHLKEVVPIDVGGSLHLVNKYGEIQYYRPSGALWAQNSIADNGFPDERRPWKVKRVEDEATPGDYKLVLGSDDQDTLEKLTVELFKRAGLLPKEAYFANIELDQVAKIDKEQKEVERFAGEATVRFLYRLENWLVDGPGAKSYAFFNPGEKAPELTGIYHAWREIDDARTIEMVDVKESLEKAISQDPELMQYHKKGFAIKLTKIELVYFTMPPYKYQEYVFPTLYIIGSAVPRDKELKNRGFEFARFYHAAPQKSYEKAKIFADYLLFSL